LLSILQERRVLRWPARSAHSQRLLARKRIHGPANPNAEQQKQQQRPNNILNALQRAPPAEKAKCDGDHQREEQHRLQVAQMKVHPRLSLPPARGLVSVQRAQQVEDTCSREKTRPVIAVGV